MKTLYNLVILVGFVVFSLTSFSQTRNITGTGNWDASNRWSGGNIAGVGSNSHDVVLSKEKYITVRSGYSYTIRSINANQASRITIEAGGELIITGNADFDKEVIITVSGTLKIEGSLDLKKEIRITNNAGGFIDIGQDFSIGKSSNITNNGYFNVLGSASTNSEGSLNGTEPLFVNGTCSGSLCSDSQISGTLPIELVSFKAYAEQNEVVLVWITASEINNDKFIIQKSKNGKDYEIVDELDGQGTKNTTTEYIYKDSKPYEGLSFYKLKQTDFDGEFSETDAVSINFKGAENFEVEVYPNPINEGHNLYLKVPTSENEEFEVFVNDLLGKSYITDLTFINQGDFTLIILELDSNLPKGAYFINILQSGKVISKKVLVQ